jgi:hypothetical protein
LLGCRPSVRLRGGAVAWCVDRGSPLPRSRCLSMRWSPVFPLLLRGTFAYRHGLTRPLWADPCHVRPFASGSESGRCKLVLFVSCSAPMDYDLCRPLDHLEVADRPSKLGPSPWESAPGGHPTAGSRREPRSPSWPPIGPRARPGGPRRPRGQRPTPPLEVSATPSTTTHGRPCRV